MKKLSETSKFYSVYIQNFQATLWCKQEKKFVAGVLNVSILPNEGQY